MKIFDGLNVQQVDTLPSAGIAGRVLFLTTDGHFYGDNGVSWDDLTHLTPKVVTTSADPYDILDLTGVVFVFATAKGGQTVNLPENCKATITVKNKGGGVVTVNPQSSVIDEQANKQLSNPEDFITTVFDGANWQIISRFP